MMHCYSLRAVRKCSQSEHAVSINCIYSLIISYANQYYEKAQSCDGLFRASVFRVKSPRVRSKCGSDDNIKIDLKERVIMSNGFIRLTTAVFPLLECYAALVDIYRHFRTAYPSHLQGSRVDNQLSNYTA